MKLGHYYITISGDIALLRRIIFTVYQTSTMSKPYPEDLKWSKTCFSKHWIISLLHNSTIGNRIYPQTKLRSSFRPFGLIPKPQINNYPEHNCKTWCKAYPPRRTNRSPIRYIRKKWLDKRFYNFHHIPPIWLFHEDTCLLLSVIYLPNLSKEAHFGQCPTQPEHKLRHTFVQCSQIFANVKAM